MILQGSEGLQELRYISDDSIESIKARELTGPKDLFATIKLKSGEIITICQSDFEYKRMVMGFGNKRENCYFGGPVNQYE
jgi:hypothetical protein